MEWLWVGIAAIWVYVAYMWIYKISNKGHIFVRKHLFRDRIVECKGVQYDWNRDTFRTPVHVDKVSGRVQGWRHPEHKIGPVLLNQDGTGDYHGRIEWKEV